MSCIDDGLIQKYIDGETTLSEENLIREHISGCEKCSGKIDAQGKLAISIKQTINSLGDIRHEIPELVIPVIPGQKRRSKIRIITISLSAACVLFFALLFTVREKPQSDEEIILLNIPNREYDANRTVFQQQLIISVIGSDGTITEYLIE